MKPGDLVMISPPEIITDRTRWIELFRGKTGLIVGFTPEQAQFHPYYRLWDVLLDGKVKSIQGMNLVVIDEER